MNNSPTSPKLTVCYFGTYRSEYSRNVILINGLRSNNIDVIECHEELWNTIEDRVDAVKNGFFSPKLWTKTLRVYIKLINNYLKIKNYDVMVIGYPGQFDVYLGRILTWLRRKKLVWDVFMSIYLISIERGLEKSNRLAINFIKIIEYIALRLPDKLIIDTKYYAVWLNNTYKTDLNRFTLIPTGADDQVFAPIEISRKDSYTIKVLYYGTYIPNHGVHYILEAARLLKDNLKIEFEFVGEGPELESCRNFANQYQLANVRFIPWVEKKELQIIISEADIVLGAFGQTPQSLMTVQNKIYEATAMRKMVITGNSPAIRDAFTDQKEILLCDRNNPNSLAEEIINISNNKYLIELIATNGYNKYLQQYSTLHCGRRLADLFRELI